MAEKIDFSDTFSLFFSEPESKKACDCGATENIYILYTTEAGTQVWQCESCKAKEQARRDAHQHAAEASIAMHLEMD